MLLLFIVHHLLFIVAHCYLILDVIFVLFFSLCVALNFVIAESLFFLRFCFCSWAFWMFRNGLIYFSYFILRSTLHVLWDLSSILTYTLLCLFRSHVRLLGSVRLDSFRWLPVRLIHLICLVETIVDIGPGRIEPAHVLCVCIRIAATATGVTALFYFMRTEKKNFAICVYMKNPIEWICNVESFIMASGRLI